MYLSNLLEVHNNSKYSKNNTRGFKCGPRSAEPKGSFLDQLTAEEAALFIEHAKDDDQPGTSADALRRMGQSKTGSFKNSNLTGNHNLPAELDRPQHRSGSSLSRYRETARSDSSHRTDGSHHSKNRHRSGSRRRSTSRHRAKSRQRSKSRRRSENGHRAEKERLHRSHSSSASAASDDSGWQKQRSRKHRRANPPPMSRPGQPGSLDDRLREGLSGYGVKWYLRYLGQGKPSVEARAMAEVRMEIENEGRERHRKVDKPAPADRWKSGPKKQAHLPALAEKQKSGPQQHRPAPAKRRRSEEPTGSNKRGSNQVTPPETLGTKRQREQPPPPNSWSRSLAGLTE
ncbi:PREDICTED: serine/arginine repetitive matrix protein 5-like [Rhagoletis zephyria]|uniref:serine/arginine repetitive matrix protein 5-like n=1 Tax=Rhagoletis zephyria TaxID=28612 RepID=UPI0008118924|nr:PREDICTED: serine/arginine repetitive matrix protein 5-like [Rhagoletis zephyria]